MFSSFYGKDYFVLEGNEQIVVTNIKDEISAFSSRCKLRFMNGHSSYALAMLASLTVETFSDNGKVLGPSSSTRCNLAVSCQTTA